METLNRFQPYVLSLLRIIVGLLFIQHGLVKLFGFPTGAGFPAFLSLPWFEGCIEMIGGGLIVIGLFTRYAAVITSGEMAIGYFMVHAPSSFFPYVNGGNLAILYCFVFFYLVVAADKEGEFRIVIAWANAPLIAKLPSLVACRPMSALGQERTS